MGDWKRALKDIRKELKATEPNVTKSQPSDLPRPKRLAFPAPYKPDSSRSLSTGRAQPAHKVATRRVPAPPLKDADMKATSRSAVAPKSPVPSKPLQPAPVPERLLIKRSGKLERQQYFKQPESWVAGGTRTQFVPDNEQAGAAEVVIGIDFGTSYTKAAVGLRDQILPVSWEGITSQPEKYLLPSEYSILKDGAVVFGQASGNTLSVLRQDLKIPFVDPAVSSASIANAAVFVGMVIQYVRAWVYRHHGGKLGKAKIRWMFNLGAPCNGLETSRTRLAYERLARAAWMLSLQSPREMNTAAADATKLSADIALPDVIDCRVQPEFVAQIAGYVQSPQRTDGLHALVDIGGGTMDVVTFIIQRKEGDDRFHFLVPSVEWLGTQVLQQNRLVGADTVSEALLPDPIDAVTDAESFAARTGASAEDVRKRDNLLFAKAQGTVAGVFARTKAKRYRLSESWEKGLKTFVSGGGASLAGYQTAITRGGMTKARKVELIPLPMHPRLAEFDGDEADYQRISVACGLALDAFSLGEIIPAADVADDEPVASHSVERPGWEEYYS